MSYVRRAIKKHAVSRMEGVGLDRKEGWQVLAGARSRTRKERPSDNTLYPFVSS